MAKNKDKMRNTSLHLNEKNDENNDIIENEIQDEDFYNKDDFITTDDIYDIENNNNQAEKDLIEQSEEYKAKIKKSGVIFLSYVPEGLTIKMIRQKFEDYKPRRIYLKPLSGKRNSFKEGWIEFEDKIMAKLCEYELNGKEIGGKKREALSSEIWNLRYLHKFKWHHLVEKLQLMQKIKQQELKTAINQAHRENQFIMESYQQSHNKRTKEKFNPDIIKESNDQIKRKEIKQIKKIG